jgi:tetratricopeptide (TPR) repeat protein
VSYFALNTYERTFAWRSSTDLWSDAAQAGDVVGYFRVARIELNKNKTDDAVRNLDKAVVITEQLPDQSYPVYKARLQKACYILLVRAYAKMGKNDEVKRIYYKWNNVYPEDYHPLVYYLDYLASKGYYKELEKEYNKMIIRYPQTAFKYDINSFKAANKRKQPN